MRSNLPRRPRFRLLAAATVLLTALAAALGPGPVDATTGDECQISKPDSAFKALVETSPDHAQVWRLYQAAFLRQPDGAGLEYWVDVARGGATVEQIAAYFTAGPEFKNRYGSLSNAQFVNLVYRNVLCRDGADDPNGANYWTNQLNSGSLSRQGLVVNFTELREYLRSTETCHSIYDNETAAATHCKVGGLVPLNQATLGANGYQAFNQSIPNGSFSGVVVDLTRVLADGRLSTGPNRCSVASINGNWLVASQKDGPDPGVLGVGVIDGRQVKNSSDRTDRGVFGLRVDANPRPVIENFRTGRAGGPYEATDTRLNSIGYHDGTRLLEQWHAYAEASIWLKDIEPEHKVGPNEWISAAAGIPLIIDGQLDPDINDDYARNPYTYDTVRHTFVAVDQNTKRLVFGGTDNARVRDIVAWARANGYEDLIKFDGGGSAEFNVAGRAVEAGTARDIPLWIGLGC